MNFSRVKNLTFFLALITVSGIFLYILRPFLYPILWAAIIAGMFYPVYDRIKSRIKNTNFSSLITIIIVFFIIIIPVIFLSSLLIKELMDLYNWLKGHQELVINTAKNGLNWLQHNPIIDKFNINDQAITDKLTEITNRISEFTLKTATNLAQDSLTFLALFIIMFYTLFFFLKDGEKLLKKIAHISPLGDNYELKMYKKFTSTTRSVLKGTLIVGAVQGALAGFLFYVIGIEGALIWGIITMLFAIIPGFGSYVIWLPAALIMLVSGNFWQGIVIILVGLFISSVDNLIRPILVGKDTQMHPLLILFSTLGGLLIFGVSGFIIGPIITALFLSLWEMYEQYYQQDLDNNTDDK